MTEQIAEFIAGLPEIAQWLGVMLAGAIPFIESYGASAIGIVIGINPVIAIVAAIIGNILSMLAFVLSAHRIRSTVVSRKEPKPESPRRRKLRERFDKFGVVGVSLLGQTLLPSQITSAAMISFGASKKAVIFWQIISIIIWGVGFGVIATLGVSALS